MRLFWLVAVITFVADQATKYAVVLGLNLREIGVIEVWPPYLTFRMAWNRGINFGLFADDAAVMRWVLIALAVGISIAVVFYTRRNIATLGRLARIGAGLLVGGALGNAIDRIVFGAVADFLNMSCCGIANPYAFNVADIAIFAGVFAIAVFGDRKQTA
jgi:signal peptidase II